MGKISDYEKKFRKHGSVVFSIVGITLDLDAVREGGWDVDQIATDIEAEWEDGHWNCHYADDDFGETTVTKVKMNISQFYRADPAIRSYQKIIVRKG